MAQEECQDGEEVHIVSREPIGPAPSQEPSSETNLAPVRVPDRGGERSQQRESSQEEVCQAKEEQEHGQGARGGGDVPSPCRSASNDASTLVSKYSEFTKSNLLESQNSASPAKRRKVKCVCIYC